MLDRILGKDVAFYVKSHKGLVAIAILLTAVSSLFVVIPAYLLQPFIDEGMKMGHEPTNWAIPWLSLEPGSFFKWHRTDMILIKGISPNRLLVVLTLIAFFSVLFRSITSYLSQLAAVAFSNMAIKSLRIDLYKKFIALPMGFYDRHSSGTLISRSTADLTVMQERISNIIIGLVQHPLTALVFLIYLLLMNFRLTVIVFIIAPGIVALVKLFGRKVKKHSVWVQDATAGVTSSFQETLLCLKIIQGFCTEGNQTEKFKDLADSLYKKIMHWNRWYLGIGPMMDSAVFLVLPGILLVGKIYFQHSLGEIISILYAFSRVYSPVKSLARVNAELRTLQGATERVFDIIRTAPEIVDLPGAKDLPDCHISIEFKNVCFSYKPGNPVLKDISFKVKAGEMVAFAGSTGAGKSTIMDLIPRFYDVTEGCISIDNMDIREARLSSLRRQIGIVSQDVLLFNDSIANNISYASPGKEMEDIIEAAKAAHAHDFIIAQPKSYGTMVGDRGTLLSGGQKQRIAIARAILANPAILLLDEVASALDAESEASIKRTIEELRGNKTIFIVAHRLSTVKKADKIFILEGGRIVESGTYPELLKLNGRFRQLHDMQFS